MKSFKIPALAAFSLIAVFIGAGAVRQGTGITKTQAAAIAITFLQNAGENIKANEVIGSRSGSKRPSWHMILRESKENGFIVIVDEGKRQVKLANSDRNALRHKGLGRTGKQQFSSQNAAKQYVSGLLNRFKGDRVYELEEFRLTNDLTINGKVIPGELWAKFGQRVNGYPIVDRSSYIAFKIDPQDGALLSYADPLNAPEIQADRTVNVTRAQAEATILSRRKLTTASAPRYEMQLGYAVKTGASKASLMWRMWQRGKSYAYFVDAKSGEYIGILQ